MVSQRDDIGPRIQNLVGLAGENAGPRGVFPVDHGEVRSHEPLQSPQLFPQEGQSAFVHHVSHRKYVHAFSPVDVFHDVHHYSINLRGKKLNFTLQAEKTVVK